MPASPYPLAGEARDVVEDVRRLGGFGIAAHPDSPKPELRWTDGARRSTASSAEPRHRLAALGAAGERSGGAVDGAAPPAVGADRLSIPSGGGDHQPDPAHGRAAASGRQRWRQRRIVAIAGVDAHAKIAPRSADPGDSRYALPFPGYESSFRVLSIHVKPDRPFSGDAVADARVLMRAIRAGHLYTAIDGAATPAVVRVHRDQRTRHGERGRRARRRRTGDAPRPQQRAGRRSPRSSGRTASWSAAIITSRPACRGRCGPGRLPGRDPFDRTGGADHLGQEQSDLRARSRRRTSRRAARLVYHQRRRSSTARRKGGASNTIPTSLAAVDLAPIVGGAELRFRYGLAGGASVGQVAALAFDTPGGLAGYDRLAFTIRAEHPMRISVQLRAGDDQGPAARERWKRTVYADVSAQERTIFFDDLTPVGETHMFAPILAGIRTILSWSTRRTPGWGTRGGSGFGKRRSENQFRSPRCGR